MWRFCLIHDISFQCSSNITFQHIRLSLRLVSCWINTACMILPILLLLECNLIEFWFDFSIELMLLKCTSLFLCDVPNLCPLSPASVPQSALMWLCHFHFSNLILRWPYHQERTFFHLVIATSNLTNVGLWSDFEAFFKMFIYLLLKLLTDFVYNSKRTPSSLVPKSSCNCIYC